MSGFFGTGYGGGAIVAGQIAATAFLTQSLEATSPDLAVTFGDFVFFGWEIPEQITWGGAQRLNVHKHIGGDRTVDAMGPDHMDISWSGIFLGKEASVRADELDYMRKEGKLLPLMFAGRYYQAVISEFNAEQKHLAHVPYKITFVVQEDQSQATIQYIPNPQAEVLADVIAMLNFLQTPPKEMLQIAIAASKIAPFLLPIQVLAHSAKETADTIRVMRETDAAINENKRIHNNSVDRIAALGFKDNTVLGATTPIAAVSTMTAAGIATENVAVSQASGAYLGRAINTAEAA